MAVYYPDFIENNYLVVIQQRFYLNLEKKNRKLSRENRLLLLLFFCLEDLDFFMADFLIYEQQKKYGQRKIKFFKE